MFVDTLTLWAKTFNGFGESGFGRWNNSLQPPGFDLDMAIKSSMSLNDKTLYFQINDINEDEFRKDIEMRDGENNKKYDDKDDDQNEILSQMTNEERAKFNSISVSNPLNLPNDDPLIICARFRRWKTQKSSD